MSHEGTARVRHFQPRVIIFDCRMTNNELLRWLVKTRSRDVQHYRMITASRSTGSHYNDYRSTVTRWSFDNAERHVIAFWPISEAARCWSCDNQIWWPSVENVALGLCPHATFSTEGPSYLDVRLTTMHPLYNVMCALVMCMTYLPPSVYVVYGSFIELAL